MKIKQLLQHLADAQADKSDIFQQFQALDKLDTKRKENLGKIKACIQKIEKLLTPLEKPLPHREEITTALDTYKKEFEGTETDIKKHFGNDLEQALKPLRLQLHGQYPTLYAGNFTFQLNFDLGKVALWYGFEQEKLAETPLIPDKLAKELEKKLKTLGSEMDEATFVTKLKEAYARSTKKGCDGRAPIISVLGELAFLIQGEQFYQNPIKDNYRSYSRADFSYDLHRFRKPLLSQGLHLVIAVKQYTQHRRDFLWIPDGDRGGGMVYSHLHFKE